VGLADLKVLAPCQERWEEMPGDDRARHCARCQERVVDLAALEEREAEALLARRAPGEGLCVRLARGPDGAVVTRSTHYRALVDVLARFSKRGDEG
jgi:hypothetical protein